MGRFLHIVGLFAVVLFATPVCAAEAQRKFPPDEKLSVSSLTMTDEQFLRGDTAKGVPVTLTAELQFPNWDEQLPAVVLLHGSDGPSHPTAQWRGLFTQMGVATLRLDSFAGRGIKRVVTDQSQLSLFAQFYDTYRAIEVLAAHPRIDRSRIAVMGFSRGGVAALYTSMRRFQQLYGPAGVRIAAHLSFYPACNIQFIGELDVADAPIREFHGAADDWTPAAPCRGYIARLKAAGKDAVMFEYPGALHGFDAGIQGGSHKIPNAQSTRNCQRREEDGKMINVVTGKPFSYNDACVQLGVTEGYDKAATEAAQIAVKEFLTGVFGRD